MNLNEKVKVNVRLKPTTETTPWITNANVIKLDEIKKANFEAEYDNIVMGESNSDIYNNNIKQIVSSSMEGYNGTIFAYGQTSSGKTYTMTGNEAEPGIIPQAIDDIFNYIKQTRESKEFLLRVSYIEIYNEKIKDLLNPKNNSDLRVVEDPVRGVYIQNLKEEIVTTPKQVMKIIDKGELNRHVADTDYNLLSSRSHTIFQVIIESKKIENKAPFSPRLIGNFKKPKSIRFSILNLIDLAGSEKLSNSLERKKEAAYINKSLLTLGTVISKIAEGDTKHIPYRDSKLTRILQSSLTGYCKIGVICCINSNIEQVDESLNTLRFALRLKKIVTKSKTIKLVEDKALLQKYKHEIESLKEKLESINEDKEIKLLKDKNKQYADELNELHLSKVALKERIDHLTKLILTPVSLSDKNYKRSRPLSVFYNQEQVNTMININTLPKNDERRDNNERMKKLLSDLRFKNRYIEELEKNIENSINNGDELIKKNYENVKKLKDTWDKNLEDSLLNQEHVIEKKVENTLKRVSTFKNRQSLVIDPKELSKLKEEINKKNEQADIQLEDYKEMEMLMEEQNKIIIELEEDRKVQNKMILDLKDQIKKLELKLFDYQLNNKNSRVDELVLKVDELKSELDNERKLRFAQQLRNFEENAKLQNQIVMLKNK